MKIFKNKKILFLLLIIIAVIGFLKVRKAEKFDITKFDFEEVDKGNINKIIIANGLINPVNVVSIGVQITGMITDIYVDYNDNVKKGDILARLDTRMINEELNEAKELMDNKKILLDLQKSTLERSEKLFKKEYISKAEFEEQKKNYETIKSTYETAKARYNKCKIELDYTTIRTPVSGIIVSRRVDVGQTVTANVKVPDLFIIAEDLTKMQIEVSITESDIINIKPEQKVLFSVDAFKDKMFKGTIKNVRLSSEINQGIVLYTAIVSIENKDLLLFPGMSAYVYIPVESAENVLRLKNTAFLFKPDEKLMKKLNIENILNNKQKRELLESNDNNTIIYVLRNNKIEPIIVEKGLSDSGYTELVTEQLKEGDKVISNYFDKK